MSFVLSKEVGKYAYFSGVYNGKKYEIIYKRYGIGANNYYIYDRLNNVLDESTKLYKEVNEEFLKHCLDFYKLAEKLQNKE